MYSYLIKLLFSVLNKCIKFPSYDTDSIHTIKLTNGCKKCFEGTTSKVKSNFQNYFAAELKMILLYGSSSNGLHSCRSDSLTLSNRAN